MTPAQLGLIVALAINFIAILVLVWRIGNWTGRVTTLLEEHQEHHEKHFAKSEEHAVILARLEEGLSHDS